MGAGSAHGAVLSKAFHDIFVIWFPSSLHPSHVPLLRHDHTGVAANVRASRFLQVPWVICVAGPGILLESAFFEGVVLKMLVGSRRQGRGFPGFPAGLYS